MKSSDGLKPTISVEKFCLEELEKGGLWQKFGLSPKFYFLPKQKKQELFQKALKSYEQTCCLKSSLTKPQNGHYFGEMCYTCSVTAQILLYGFVNGFQKPEPKKEKV